MWALKGMRSALSSIWKIIQLLSLYQSLEQCEAALACATDMTVLPELLKRRIS